MSNVSNTPNSSPPHERKYKLSRDRRKDSRTTNQKQQAWQNNRSLSQPVFKAHRKTSSPPVPRKPQAHSKFLNQQGLELNKQKRRVSLNASDGLHLSQELERHTEESYPSIEKTFEKKRKVFNKLWKGTESHAKEIIEKIFAKLNTAQLRKIFTTEQLCSLVKNWRDIDPAVLAHNVNWETFSENETVRSLWLVALKDIQDKNQTAQEISSKANEKTQERYEKNKNNKKGEDYSEVSMQKIQKQAFEQAKVDSHFGSAFAIALFVRLKQQEHKNIPFATFLLNPATLIYFFVADKKQHHRFDPDAVLEAYQSCSSLIPVHVKTNVDPMLKAKKEFEALQKPFRQAFLEEYQSDLMQCYRRTGLATRDKHEFKRVQELIKRMLVYGIFQKEIIFFFEHLFAGTYISKVDFSNIRNSQHSFSVGNTDDIRLLRGDSKRVKAEKKSSEGPDPIAQLIIPENNSTGFYYEVVDSKEAAPSSVTITIESHSGLIIEKSKDGQSHIIDSVSGKVVQTYRPYTKDEKEAYLNAIKDGITKSKEEILKLKTERAAVSLDKRQLRAQAISEAKATTVSDRIHEKYYISANAQVSALEKPLATYSELESLVSELVLALDLAVSKSSTSISEFSDDVDPYDIISRLTVIQNDQSQSDESSESTEEEELLEQLGHFSIIDSGKLDGRFTSEYIDRLDLFRTRFINAEKLTAILDARLNSIQEKLEEIDKALDELKKSKQSKKAIESAKEKILKEKIPLLREKKPLETERNSLKPITQIDITHRDSFADSIAAIVRSGRESRYEHCLQLSNALLHNIQTVTQILEEDIAHFSRIADRTQRHTAILQRKVTHEFKDVSLIAKSLFPEIEDLDLGNLDDNQLRQVKEELQKEFDLKIEKLNESISKSESYYEDIQKGEVPLLKLNEQEPLEEFTDVFELLTVSDTGNYAYRLMDHLGHEADWLKEHFPLYTSIKESNTKEHQLNPNLL